MDLKCSFVPQTSALTLLHLISANTLLAYAWDYTAKHRRHSVISQMEKLGIKVGKSLSNKRQLRTIFADPRALKSLVSDLRCFISVRKCWISVDFDFNYFALAERLQSHWRL